MRDAFLGASRFGEFQRSLGIARNVLTQRLPHLVDEGVFEHGEDGAYVLTRKGRELAPALHQLLKWGDRHYAPDGPPRLTLTAAAAARSRATWCAGAAASTCGSAISRSCLVRGSQRQLRLGRRRVRTAAVSRPQSCLLTSRR